MNSVNSVNQVNRWSINAISYTTVGKFESFWWQIFLSLISLNLMKTSQWSFFLNYDIKRTRAYHPATSCVRDQHATTVPARHMWEIGSLNWAQFMLQWFISFSEFTEFSESSAPLEFFLLFDLQQKLNNKNLNNKSSTNMMIKLIIHWS